MNQNDDLIKRLEGLSDKELIDMIEINSSDYTEESLTIARQIISKRGGSKKIKENLKLQEKEFENQQIEEFEKSIKIQQSERDKKRTVIKLKPSLFRILFCFVATIFAFNKTFYGIGALEDSSAVYGRLIAFFVFMYILWGSTFKLFPRSIKKISIFNNQIFLYNAFGTEMDVIKTINSANVDSSDSLITINGINKKSKDKSFEIAKKKIGSTNFALIKSILIKNSSMVHFSSLDNPNSAIGRDAYGSDDKMYLGTIVKLNLKTSTCTIKSDFGKEFIKSISDIYVQKK